MIKGFADRATEDIYHGFATKRALRFPRELWPLFGKKLDMLNASADVRDLVAPPGNRLEKLRGDLEGYYSIRVNERFRIIFKWRESNAYDVQITDYHRG